ncbi:MAG TPA: hypothetical protein VNT53_00615 [Pseudolysinimonas sp.]|nr:hypothetical protein [Pseudolysinimonas sp.]
MTLTMDAAIVSVGADGTPTHLVWHAQRYRVSDMPTPLDFDLTAITHLAVVPVGWRFQGTDEDGHSLVFDVVSFDDGQQWRVVRTYE